VAPTATSAGALPGRIQTLAPSNDGGVGYQNRLNALTSRQRSLNCLLVTRRDDIAGLVADESVQRVGSDEAAAGYRAGVGDVLADAAEPVAVAFACVRGGDASMKWRKSSPGSGGLRRRPRPVEGWCR
jgi:hypothetical protein